eukprot:TRINITY_DN26074_c0_g1_i1.p1 TRINITY_DN26074_c0_g1~~TRINITY_DN26074_c0_g1_i1.p1  ORF type:complete len:384 (+),score=51.38 TRINITY_DN26074_c0_g1_i1:98-1249(+)
MVRSALLLVLAVMTLAVVSTNAHPNEYETEEGDVLWDGFFNTVQHAYRETKRVVENTKQRISNGATSMQHSLYHRFAGYKTDPSCISPFYQAISDLTAQTYNTLPWHPAADVRVGGTFSFTAFNNQVYTWKLLHKFSSSGMGDAQASVFQQISPPTKRVVLSFRGSESLRDWGNNFQVETHHYDDKCYGSKIHAGFLRAWNSVRGSIFTYFNTNARFMQEGYEMVVTGHSLGGAMASLASYEIAIGGINGANSNNVLPLLFAPPQVGVKTWKDCYARACPRAIRFENWFYATNCLNKRVYSRDTVTNVLDKLGFQSIAQQCKLGCGFSCSQRCCATGKEVQYGVFCHSPTDYTAAFRAGHAGSANFERERRRILAGFSQMARV